MMDVTEDQLREGFLQSGWVFGIDVDPSEIPKKLIETVLPLARDFFLAEDMSVAIKSHLRVESLLDEFLKAASPRPKFLTKVARTYENKVGLALLLGLPTEHETSLRSLGKIRNRFAHDSEAVWRQDLLDDLYRSFPEEKRDFIQMFFCRIRELDPSLAERKTFRDLKPIEQFRFLVMVLWISLYISVDSAVASQTCQTD